MTEEEADEEGEGDEEEDRRGRQRSAELDDVCLLRIFTHSLLVFLWTA